MAIHLGGKGFGHTVRTPLGIANLYNVSPATLSKWKAAVTRVKGATGRGRVLIMGDSTIFGYGATYSTNLRAQLETNLNAAGIATSFKSWIGTGGQSAATLVAYDPRMSYQAGVVNNATFDPVTGNGTAVNVLGGSRVEPGAAKTLSFTPAGQIDHIDVLYQTYNGAGWGTFAINVDGGAPLTNSGDGNAGPGSLSMAKVSNTCTRGAHTINLVNTTGNTWLGCVAWDSTVPAIDFLQAGVPQARVHLFNDYAYPSSPLNETTGFTGPMDLVIIDLTINDSNNLTTMANYSADLTNIITSIKSNLLCDVLLISGPPSSGQDGPTLQTYLATCKSVAIANGCGFVDLVGRWGSYASSSALYSDTVHPNLAGYTDWAKLLSSALLSV